MCLEPMIVYRVLKRSNEMAGAKMSWYNYPACLIIAPDVLSELVTIEGLIAC